ncbi:stage II sporulation protein M [Spiractinospora alimapuensis]|uniref:stage II sporulation protein M n=1 Tax=Spiractinospora alimapuensis TaxID=2820884 RepID=UPI001F2759C8|nr:stage II sporulation protein M [Spiractinospora alimapuensis]QVQ54369.1 stage II sporulation protein M [Spiractinospora alimapuensis]
MDLDLFVAANRRDWDRLDSLTKRRRRLTGAEVDELMELYQRVSTHLSVVRSGGLDPALAARLSGLVARARAAIVGGHVSAWREVGRFFTETFPAAVYRLRWWWLTAGAAFILFATGVGAWVARNPDVQAALATPDEIQNLVEHEFANYYVEYDSAAFAAQVWTNNALVAAQCLVLGVFLMLPVLYVLALNAANVGVLGGFMFANDRGDIFLGLLLPHGMLELTAVFVAAGVGLKVGWSLIEPGARTRGRALAEEGRSGIAVALGLVAVLFVSGLIEGFVTGYVHITWLRISIGAAALGLFLVYVFTLGRTAAQRGVSGDIMERPANAPVVG